MNLRMNSFQAAISIHMVVLPALLLAGVASAAPLDTLKNIVYSRLPGADTALMSLDVYVPRGAASAPVMVYVHGGSWYTGDKSAVGYKPAFFSDMGCIFASINYRLTDTTSGSTVRWPIHGYDVASAIAWIYRNIRNYGGDSSRVFIMGHSAGSHLASIAATNETFLAAEGLPLSVIKGVIALDTQAYNLFMLAGPDRQLAQLYAVTFTQDTALWRTASPALNVAPGKGIAPFVICYSGGINPPSEAGDRRAQAGAFLDTLLTSGYAADTVGAPTVSHAQINQNFGTPGDSVTTAAWEKLMAMTAQTFVARDSHIRVAPVHRQSGVILTINVLGQTLTHASSGMYLDYSPGPSGVIVNCLLERKMP